MPHPDPDRPDPNRDPLPAGHPVSWSLLTAGTCLQGTPYACPARSGTISKAGP
jgi:hypothetical protein